MKLNSYKPKEEFRILAHNISKFSNDNATKTGAVIVTPTDIVIATGYNFKMGNNLALDRDVRPEKYYWYEHAERSAIYNAARQGKSTNGCIIYLSCGIPCMDCMRAIISSGIRTIVCERTNSEINTGSKQSMWNEHAVRSLTLAKETSIHIIFYD